MEKPILTVDIIIERNGKIALVKRGKEPYLGKLTIPGGHVEYEETVEQAAIREAKEETSCEIRLKVILGVYSDPARDPRYHSISTVFIAEGLSENLKGGTDAAEAGWYSLDEIDMNELGFDHAKILNDYKKWRKDNGTYWSTK